MSFQFDDFVLDEERRTLRRAGRPVALTPKALDTLLALVRRSGRLVAKDELLQAVWPDTFIEEATLAQNVFTVRKALGARAGGGAYIETVPRHGYRFAAEVRPLEAVPEPFAAEPSAAQVPADRLPRLSMRLSMRRWPAVSAALLVPIAAAVVLAAGARRRPEPAPGHVTPHLMPLLIERVERLTADGGARHAAVSGSGAYVAFVREETDGRQGLWLRQTHSGTLSQASAAVPVVPAAAWRFGGVAFAPGDRTLLYVAYPDGEAIGGLFEVPVLGGMPRRLLLDADSAPAVSADGTRLAFVRNEPAARASALMVADRDGSHARVVARRRGRESFATEGVAWSPDGATIACAVRGANAAGRFMTVVGVSAHDGRQRPLTAHRWAEVGQIAWLPRVGLVIDAWDPRSSALSRTLWEVAIPSGAVSPLTHDLGDYAGVSAAGDGRTLVSVQTTSRSALWVAPLAAPQRAVRISRGGGDPHGGSLGVAWTPDGRILYGSVASGNVDLWLVGADGTGRRQLTADPAPDYKPTAAPDGRSVVFTSWRGGESHVWDLDLESGEQRQLTYGRADNYPQVSRDGRSLIFVSVAADGRPRLWRAGRDGSAAVMLGPHSASLPALSPDGRSVAAFQRERGDVPMQLGVLALDGSAPPRLFMLPPTVFVPAGLQWTPDGRGVVYVDTRGELSALVRQPLDGGPPEPLANFAGQRIFRFAISPRGELVCERGNEVDDVVLLSARDPDASAAAL